MILIFVIVIGVISGCATDIKTSSVVKDNKNIGIWEAGGVKIEKISLSAAGLLIDLRYRITDLDLAKKVISNTAEMVLIDQTSGNILMIPNADKFSKMRQVPLTDDKKREYFVLFNNSGQIVKSGNKVTVTFGSLQIKDIVVQ